MWGSCFLLCILYTSHISCFSSDPYVFLKQPEDKKENSIHFKAIKELCFYKTQFVLISSGHYGSDNSLQRLLKHA